MRVLLRVPGRWPQIMWIEQLPPGLVRDPRRRCVEALRRAMFGPGSSAASLKAHLAKLQVCSLHGELSV